MADKKTSSTSVWIATFILGAVFLWVGWRILSSPDLATAFQRWGYPDWFRMMIGVLEILCALLLLYPKTAWIGASTLACIMMGATITLLRHDTLLYAAFPALFFVSLSSLAYYRFPRKAPPV